MSVQRIVSPSGDRLVILPEVEFEALVEAAEDAADRLAVESFQALFAAGEEELFPSDFVERLFSGENRIRVWCEYRGLTTEALAEKAGISQAFISQIETGKRDGTMDTLRKIASALSVPTFDLLIETSAS